MKTVGLQERNSTFQRKNGKIRVLYSDDNEDYIGVEDIE